MMRNLADALEKALDICRVVAPYWMFHQGKHISTRHAHILDACAKNATCACINRICHLSWLLHGGKMAAWNLLCGASPQAIGVVLPLSEAIGLHGMKHATVPGPKQPR